MLTVSAIVIGYGTIVACVMGKLRLGPVFPFAQTPVRKAETPKRFWAVIGFMVVISFFLAVIGIWQGSKVGFAFS
jgi:hypothetical protein